MREALVVFRFWLAVSRGRRGAWCWDVRTEHTLDDAIWKPQNFRHKIVRDPKMNLMCSPVFDLNFFNAFLFL